MVPESRKEQGLVLQRSVQENMALAHGVPVDGIQNTLVWRSPLYIWGGFVVAAISVVVALALRYAARRVPRDVLAEAWTAEPRLLDRLMGSRA